MLYWRPKTGFILERDPDTVRAPDVAYVRHDRIPAGRPPKAYWPGAPNLAVEGVSPDDSAREVEEKAGDWLRGGTSEVWVIDPASQTVAIHGRSDEVEVLNSEETLDGGTLLPGFRCPVRGLFE